MLDESKLEEFTTSMAIAQANAQELHHLVTYAYYVDHAYSKEDFDTIHGQIWEDLAQERHVLRLQYGIDS